MATDFFRNQSQTTQLGQPLYNTPDVTDAGSRVQVPTSGLGNQPTADAQASADGSSMSPETGAAIAGGVAQLGSSIIQGVATSNEAERAREEARQLADITRQDTLAQQDVSNKLKQRQQRQAEEAYGIQQDYERLSRRFNVWFKDFQNKLQNYQKGVQAAREMKTQMRQNEGLRQVMVERFGA